MAKRALLDNVTRVCSIFGHTRALVCNRIPADGALNSAETEGPFSENPP